MATREGTEKYFKRLSNKGLPDHAIQTFGSTGFKTSRIGFGGYRIQHNSIEHAKALRYALLNGLNLIDTSSNYADGGSEMLIGNLLQEMFDREELRRDEVIVVSKVGYVQGGNLKMVMKYEQDGRPFPDMVKYMDNCWHCIHPDFLEEQLSLTLERLRLPSLDVYLLHNPEYFLSFNKKQNGRPLAAVREEYYSRIKQAFEWLEEKVGEGKIQAYGISSNTFPVAADSYEFTSLERVVQVAEEITSANYFKVVQFPCNLFEMGAGVEENQLVDQQTVLQFAAANNLATMANRPLNAMFNNSMIRLASFRETPAKEVIEVFHKKLTSVQRLEKQFQDRFARKLPDEARDKITQALSLGKHLMNAQTAFPDWEQWDNVRQNYMIPQTFAVLGYLRDKLSADPDWPNWAEHYSNTALELLDVISRKYENEAQERSFKLMGKLKSLAPALDESETLSQMSLRVLTSVPELDCVLLGMRRIAYVEDALAALKEPVVDDALDLLIDFNQN